MFTLADAPLLVSLISVHLHLCSYNAICWDDFSGLLSVASATASFHRRGVTYVHTRPPSSREIGASVSPRRAGASTM